MDRADALLRAYVRQLSLPWRPDLSGAERIWIAVYPPEIERRVQAKLPDFEIETRAANHSWLLHDVAGTFSRWLAKQEYREEYYANPELLAPALPGYLATLEAGLVATLTSPDAGPTSVVALVGVGTLFPMIRVSDLLTHVSDRIQGRLLVMFPGSYEHGNYRLLDARDGWNYLAIPITISEGETR